MLKYTIEGFNQEYAMTLRKEVEINGKKGSKENRLHRLSYPSLVC